MARVRLDDRPHAFYLHRGPGGWVATAYAAGICDGLRREFARPGKPLDIPDGPARADAAALAQPAAAGAATSPECLGRGTIFDYVQDAPGHATVAAALPPPVPGASRTVRFTAADRAVVRELHADLWRVFEVVRYGPGGWLLEQESSGNPRCGPLDPEFARPGAPLGARER